MSTNFYRKLQTLSLLPSYPSRVSTAALLTALKAQGFTVEIRQLQRDLNSLAQLFEIETDGNKDIPGWYWKSDAKKLELPQMALPTALSFELSKKYLSQLFPEGVLHHLAPYFAHAQELLENSGSSLANWSNKVATVSRNQPLIPPEVDQSILNAAYLALLSETRIDAFYRPVLKKESAYQLDPKGIVIVDQIIYLVAENIESKTVQQFALHRFSGIKNTEQNIDQNDDFDLTAYLEQGNLLYPYHSPKEIKLKLQVSERAAFYLNEMRLSTDQIITPSENDDEYLVTATVQNTEQLRWWLQSYSFYIEVIEPESLREEFAEAVEILHEMYQAWA
ncbi:helix-turn-helix transcriptional regulator [Thiomicrorhabdus indica]|uniref:helix-turn-helix transcriptional regulator n=1 Tax=Thiomicrorhabdus indica TaxID=2267253 RepID=UPI00102D7831|nr:WYL domain-containing protein [Thiomicrorhabdus indica]